MSTANIDLAYRLPITTVSIDGTSTTVTNHYTKPKSKTARTSNIAVQIEADPERLWVVRLPQPEKSKATCAVGIAPDGRLTSTDANVDDQSQARLLSLVKAGAGAVATLLPVASLLLAPGLAPAIGLGALAMRAATTPGLLASAQSLTFDPATGDAMASEAVAPGFSRDPNATTTDQSDQSVTPTLKDLGVYKAYMQHDAKSAHLLANLRWSQARVEAQLAVAGTLGAHTAKSLARELSDLSKALQQIRGASVDPEAKYATWIASHAKSEPQPFHDVFVLEELPSTHVLKQAAADGKVWTDLDGDEQRWWSLLTNLRVAVSWDFEDADPRNDTSGAPLGIPPGNSPECVVFRRPRLATIVHWSAEPVEEKETTSVGDETDDTAAKPVKYKLTEVSRERKVVIVRGASLSYIPLRPMKSGTFGDKPRGDSVTGLTFDKDGILTKVSTERTDPSLARAATIEALPGVAEDVITAGTEALKPFTSEGETARLKAELDLLKAKKDLEKAKAPTPDDPLADLKATVEKAELDARQARAEAIVSNPTSSLIQISVTDPPAKSDDPQKDEDEDD